MATNTERARALKERRKQLGLVQCNVWLPRAAAPDFHQAAERIAADPDLRLRLVSQKTGRVVSLSFPANGPMLATGAAKAVPEAEPASTRPE
jgi:hypothetical protein